MQKTNAMRFLDKNKIPYNTYSYENKDGKIDGVAVAEKIGKGVECVFKTLVLQGQSRELYVFVIPVNEELDLKKAAKVAGEKKIEMIHVKDINKHTGYIRGGCSPLAMKKLYRTFIDISAEELPNMIFSGGKIGLQIEANPKDIAVVIEGRFEDITAE
ncbi:MAG TPA: Cys-tRNA(Pro) deacylase [Clostridium sp.]